MKTRKAQQWRQGVDPVKFAEWFEGRGKRTLKEVMVEQEQKRKWRAKVKGLKQDK